MATTFHQRVLTYSRDVAGFRPVERQLEAERSRRYKDLTTLLSHLKPGTLNRRPGKQVAILETYDLFIAITDEGLISVRSWSGQKQLFLGNANQTDVDLFQPGALIEILADLQAPTPPLFDDPQATAAKWLGRPRPSSPIRVNSRDSRSEKSPVEVGGLPIRPGARGGRVIG